MNSIRQKRKKIGLSQAEFARKLNIAQTTVAMWEVGARKPNIVMLKKIAEFFGCTTDELLEEFPISKQ